MAKSSRSKTSIPLPPVDECLFGISRKCPKMSADSSKKNRKNPHEIKASDGDFNLESLSPVGTDDEEGSMEEDEEFDRRGLATPASVESYDSLGMGHWGEAAQKHDINMVHLRKIASQGIADEGSHRGVTWRVLLNYLNPKDIGQSWQKELPPQRQLYKELVEQYFEGTMDKGRELRSQLSKTLRDRKLRKKFNKLQRLDEDETTSVAGENTLHEEDDEQSVATEISETSSLASPSSGQTIRRIEDRLPQIFRDQWKRSGINLDKMTQPNLTSSTAMALGVNHLAVPNFDPPEKQQQNFTVFMEDAKLLEEIRKDVTRTHPDLYFFLEPTDNLGKRRHGALERILFIWSKLNRGVRYVQGMNEIVGTLYYVLANDHNCQWANHAEADTYFLFHTLMMDMKDVFVPDMDMHTTGIQGRIDNMQRLLQTHDPEVYEHLRESGIDASFYAVRWLTTLLSREFLLPDTIRLWDSMFASTHKENFLRYVCGTMVMMVRDDLLKGDFSSCLKLLQSYPPANIDDILESSRSLWIYESQVTLACHRGGISVHQVLNAISPPPSIIMAFGMRGGLALNHQGRSHSVSRQNQEKENSANEGFLGLAQRFWSGWGTSSSPENSPATTETKVPPTPASTTDVPPSTPKKEKAIEPSSTPNSMALPTLPTPPRSPVPRSRFWNRSRSNSEAATSDAATSDAATSVDDDAKATIVKDEKTGSTPLTFTPSKTRRTIWNRSPRKTSTQDSNSQSEGISVADAEPLPALNTVPKSSSTMPSNLPPKSGSFGSTPSTSTTRRLIWNREKKATSGAESNSTDAVKVS